MRESRIWLVHGWNVFDRGEGSIDRLTAYLELLRGWVVENERLDYGWRLITHLWGNPRIAAYLSLWAGPYDVAIGHSNGCAIIHRATHMEDCQLRRVMYINPALDVTAAPGKKIRRWDVFYANDDWTVLAARFIPSVLWGAMGRYGYKGDDNRYMGHELHQFMDFKGSLGHSGALKHASLFGPRLAGMIGEAPSQEPNPTIN